MRRLALVVVVSFVATACFGPDPNLTDSGKGRPYLSVEFPDQVEAGSTNTAVLTVENPGPGDMSQVVVAFSAVGPARGGEPLPGELVPFASRKDNPVIAGIVPRPQAIAPNGVVYVFPGLEEQSSMTIRFRIVAPDRVGTAASSVTVYDGREADRARGVRLETKVTQ